MTDESEDYNYDFSDEEAEVHKAKISNPRNNAEDDEQYVQKLNGMIESYKTQLSEIQENLDKERVAHNVTKDKLENVSIEPNHKKDMNDIDSLRREIQILTAQNIADKKAYEEELSKLRRHGSATKSETSKQIKHNIDNLSKLFAIDVPYLREEEMTERDCIQILQDVMKKKNRSSMISPPKTRPATSSTQPNVDNELQQRITNLEEELRLALGAAEDIRALKAKVIQLVERLRIEKEERVKGNLELKRYGKKMEMLGDHIEKLMLHLKHEAGSKIKLSDQLKDSEKRNGLLNDKLTNLTKKMGAKDRLIAELREGSKILEDQLRLMDEKYLELRTKLDYTRDSGTKKIKKAQKIASDLRVKYALAGHTTLLDHLPMPTTNTAPAAFRTHSNEFDDYEFNGTTTGPGTTGTRKKPIGFHTQAVKGSTAWNGSPMSTEEQEARVLEKVRVLKGGKTEWTDEKIQELIKQNKK